MKHRLTIQYDATLSFTVRLPSEKEAAWAREQTPLTVVVEPHDEGEGVANFALNVRAGDGDDAHVYPQAKFVHRSAAVGAASCLLQYLKSKPELNVVDEVIGPAPLGFDAPDGQTFVAVGWKVSKRSKRRATASPAEGSLHRPAHG